MQQFLGSLVQSLRPSAPPNASRPARYRPGVEALEGRYVPSTAATPNAAYVDQLFDDLLYRDAHPAEVAFWAGLLDRGVSRTDAARLLQHGPEYRALVSDSLVRSLLGRGPLPGEVAQHVQFLSSGGTSEQLEAALLGSDEYFLTQGGGTQTGFLAALFEDTLGAAPEGPMAFPYALRLFRGASRQAVAAAVLDNPAADARDVALAYERFLQRPADAASVGHFTTLLQSNQARPEDVHAALVATPEYTRVAGLDKNQRYVNKVYLDLLGRPADPGALAQWGRLLDMGTPPPQVVLQIEAGPEYLARVVQGLYQAYLKRPADPDGLSAFVTFLQGTNIQPPGRIEAAAATLIGTLEYFTRRGGGTVTGFLQALYLDVLGRAIDPTALVNFTQAINRGATRTQVASLVLASPEYQTRFVQGEFQRLLRRPADPASLAFFVNALQSGQTQQAVIAGLAGSPEYYANAIRT